MSHVRHNMHTQAAAAAAMPFLTVTVGSRQFYTLLGWYNPPYLATFPHPKSHVSRRSLRSRYH